jgi:dTDP-4-dehydrorhamnose reductase
MRIIIVGATGTIGQKLYSELSQRHEIVKASKSKGEVKVDITSRASIEQMYKQVGKFDAVIVAAGGGYIGPSARQQKSIFMKASAVK